MARHTRGRRQRDCRAQVARVENQQPDLDVVRDCPDTLEHIGLLEIRSQDSNLYPAGGDLLGECFQRLGSARHEHKVDAKLSELPRKRGAIAQYLGVGRYLRALHSNTCKRSDNARSFGVEEKPP
jgi:hypothetical protein